MKKRYLLDTNVVSESARLTPNRRVFAMLDALEQNDVFICDIVIAEIRHGIEMVTDAVRQGRLEVWLEAMVIRPFIDRTLQTDRLSWLHWLRMKVALDAQRTAVQAPDLMIAALARQHSMTVVTRDSKPFEQAGVSVLNPF